MAKKPVVEKKAVKKTAKKEAPKAALTQEQIDAMNALMADLQENFAKCLTTAAAAKRARKATSELAKLFKAFRADSVLHHKKQ